MQGYSKVLLKLCDITFAENEFVSYLIEVQMLKSGHRQEDIELLISLDISKTFVETSNTRIEQTSKPSTFLRVFGSLYLLSKIVLKCLLLSLVVSNCHWFWTWSSSLCNWGTLGDCSRLSEWDTLGCNSFDGVRRCHGCCNWLRLRGTSSFLFFHNDDLLQIHGLDAFLHLLVSFNLTFQVVLSLHFDRTF